nr:gag precursor cleaving protease [Human T-cell leukemia virus type I]
HPTPKKLHRGGGLTSPPTLQQVLPNQDPASILPVIPLDPADALLLDLPADIPHPKNSIGGEVRRPVIKAQVDTQTSHPKTIEALLDTGADMTVLPIALFSSNTPSKIHPY